MKRLAAKAATVAASSLRHLAASDTAAAPAGEEWSLEAALAKLGIEPDGNTATVDITSSKSAQKHGAAHQTKANHKKKKPTGGGKKKKR